MSLSSLLNPIDSFIRNAPTSSTPPNSHASSPCSFASPSPSSLPSPAMTTASPATVYSDSIRQRMGPRPPRPEQRLPPMVPYDPQPQPQSQSQSQLQSQPDHIATEFIRARPKGPVNFPAFERCLDDDSLRAVRFFRIYPFGNIEEHCRHIPYASGKKDFHAKTGREGFEVFQYVFKAPNDTTEYHVMWDYHVGLVRLTPFFKCCKYGKVRSESIQEADEKREADGQTTPAKMLNQNPGLRDISHSITGGSIMAQGYWMPYDCARAVCATFCWHIRGALIPLFGPDFPAQCVPDTAPEYGRMVIDPALVAAATRETRQMHRVPNRMSDGHQPRPGPSLQARVRHSPCLPQEPRMQYLPTSVPMQPPILRTPGTSYSPTRSDAVLRPITPCRPGRKPGHAGGTMLPSPAAEHERLPPLASVLSAHAPSLSGSGSALMPSAARPISGFGYNREAIAVDRFDPGHILNESPRRQRQQQSLAAGAMDAMDRHSRGPAAPPSCYPSPPQPASRLMAAEEGRGGRNRAEAQRHARNHNDMHAAALLVNFCVQGTESEGVDSGERSWHDSDRRRRRESRDSPHALPELQGKASQQTRKKRRVVS